MDTLIGDWLARRKISPSVQREFNVRAGLTPHMGECIIIPVLTDEGVFSFNKYRRSPLREDGPKYTYDKGGHMTLYGAWKAKSEGRVLWCEGELDALVAWSANIPAVSSTGGAGSIDPSWFSFFAEKEVVICFDNDKAGGEGMVRALALVPHAKVLFLPDNAGVKDISDYVERGGDLTELLKTAKHFDSYADVMADRAERLAMFKSVHFHDAYVKMHAEKPKAERKQRVGEDAVARARSFPIPKLISFNGLGSTRCLWHNEQEASLHYYPDDNHLYCFGGCGRAYDAIDVYRKLNDCSFKEAVDALQ